jgi:hypothetical protein
VTTRGNIYGDKEEAMPDKAEIAAAVLKALVSDFHGMTRSKLVGVIGVDLGVVIDGMKDLQRLLPKLRGDGLITSEKPTWFITDKGKAAGELAPTDAVQRERTAWCHRHSRPYWGLHMRRHNWPARAALVAPRPRLVGSRCY